MSEMIERVAAAIHLAWMENSQDSPCQTPFSMLGDKERAFGLVLGRAALEAQKTPTLPMINAMTKRLGEGWDSITTATDVWTVGIDEALKEGQS